jgi:hypothetical protein
MAAQDTATIGKNASDEPSFAGKPPVDQKKSSATERIGVVPRRR